MLRTAFNDAKDHLPKQKIGFCFIKINELCRHPNVA
jgi:hypothetical protein